MACGEYGEGKMSSPRQIYAYLKNYFDQRNIIKHKKFKALVTTGPTREYLDPIRYISNESSGKQGYEVALALNRLGIKTKLIIGPSDLILTKDLKIKRIVSAKEMMNEVKKSLPDYLGKNNKARPKIVVGFSAETNNVIQNSMAKIKEKYCDLIIANDVSKKDFGFNSEYNKVFVIDKKGAIKSIPKNKKSFIANTIAKIILNKLLINDKNIN